MISSLDRSGFVGSHNLRIRNALPGDLPKILEILNHYIHHHHATFDTAPWTVEQKQAWFDSNTIDGPYQLLVATEGDDILGYAFSARWRPKKGYDKTAESTVYVHPDHLGRGIGALVLSELLERLRGKGLQKLVAGISQPNEASNRLHEKLGFSPVGTFHGVGTKFGKSWDVSWYEYDF